MNKDLGSEVTPYTEFTEFIDDENEDIDYENVQINEYFKIYMRYGFAFLTMRSITNICVGISILKRHFGYGTFITAFGAIELYNILLMTLIEICSWKNSYHNFPYFKKWIKYTTFLLNISSFVGIFMLSDAPDNITVYYTICILTFSVLFSFPLMFIIKNNKIKDSVLGIVFN